MSHADWVLDAQALLNAESLDALPSRRTAIKAALGVGYAAAAMPIMAQTAIKTSSDGLLTGEVNIDVNGFNMPAFRAAPVGRTGLPVVLVISEVFGVHEHIADVTRRLAHAGYFAIAPELFVRQGDAQSYGEVSKLIAEVVSKVPDQQVVGDLDATVAWAATQGADATRLGVTGFCWGGRHAWMYAAHQAAVKAAVAWYGRLEGNESELTPSHPVDLAAKLRCPVLGLYGGADSGIPLASVDKMKQALASGSAPAQASRFVIYADAPHAFHADYRPTYRKDAAIDGYQQALAWFKVHGVG